MEKVEELLYKPRKILNTCKHADGGWFWNKYSALPYVGCQYACPFCYEIGTKYSASKTPEEYGNKIKIKENAPELLRKELGKVKKDVIVIGDYQPIEAKYRISRKLLEVCEEYGFPVLVIARSPLVVQDIDILQRINEKTWSCVIFSVSYMSSEKYRNIFEPRAPLVEGRFDAMRKLSEAGIHTGVAFMPIHPFISDSNENIEWVVKQTKEHDGEFVLGGGLTLEGGQVERYLSLIEEYDPALLDRYQKYLHGDEKTMKEYNSIVARRVRSFCKKYGISDRLKRYIVPGSNQVNKRVAEILFQELYELELLCENKYKIWAYRKAAWKIDEMEEKIDEIYQTEGKQGILSLDGIGKGMADRIVNILDKMADWVENKEEHYG